MGARHPDAALTNGWDCFVNYMNTLREQVNTMAVQFVAMLPQLAIGAVIIVITWVVAKFAVRFVDRLTGRTRLRPSLQALIETLLKIGVWLIGLMIAATVMMPGLSPSGMLAGLGFGAVAIGFAFQDIFENFLAGVLIMLREKMRIGDVIECEGVKGRVEHITLRETHIRQLSNELTIMPNSMVFKNPVRILTDDKMRRDEVIVGVSYDTDLEQAQTVICDTVRALEAVNQDKDVIVYAQEFNSSSVDFMVQWWATSSPRELRRIKSEVIIAVKKALDKAGIEIPFPYVTHTFKEPVPIVPPSSDGDEQAA